MLLGMTGVLERGESVKRVLAWVLCFILVLSLLPVAAFGAKKEQTKEDILRKKTAVCYARSLNASGRTSFEGYCGLMSSYQMWVEDINDWCVINDGKDQFDYYAQLDITSGGYQVRPYYASDYSLEEALNEVCRYGTKDVYNILVGFQSTDTEAGALYGHSVFINGIIDGNVYFTEQYESRFVSYKPEGQPIICPIARFAEHYDNYAAFEGLVWFGDGKYADSCESQGTNLLTTARFDTTLRSEPCVVGQNECWVLRSISGGERLRATAVVKNKAGDYFYQVQDGDLTGYIAAAALFVEKTDPLDLELKDEKLPGVVSGAYNAGIDGSVIARHGGIAKLGAVVTDSLGKQVRHVTAEVTGYRAELALLNQQLALDNLEPGHYKLELYAQNVVPAVVGGKEITLSGKLLLRSKVVQVGGIMHVAKAQPQLRRQVPQPDAGWVQMEDGWHYLREGESLTGWQTVYGVRYYFDADGAAVTGWQEVDGVTRYFSETGAMCTGWLHIGDEVYFRNPDGSAYTGWLEFAGKLHCFNDDGVMITNKRVKKDGVVYIIDRDGVATKR